MRINSYLGLIGFSALSCLALTQIASAEVVGTMTALQTQIAGNNGKNLSVGAKISLGDQLSSNKTGLGMIVFDDESSAKIGPNSKLVIDEFVYQPGRGNGKVAVNMNSGLVRFYGGQISKSGKMQVTTPHIVLGIRGGILDTRVSKAFTKSILRAGRMTCSVNGQTKTITKPGFACVSDGKVLKVELSKDDDMDLLDSQDMIAGNGVPGRKGEGIVTAAACVEGSNDASQLCKSANGALPGLTGRTGRGLNPLPPFGSEKTPVEVGHQDPCIVAQNKKTPANGTGSNTGLTSTFAFVPPTTGTTGGSTITAIPPTPPTTTIETGPTTTPTTVCP